MMSFDVEKYIYTPTVEQFNWLKKSELLQLTQHYELMVDNSVRKTHLVVLKYLVDEEMILSMETVSWRYNRRRIIAIETGRIQRTGKKRDA